MKNLTFIITIGILVLFTFGCENSDEKFYSTDEQINKWVKINLNALKKLAERNYLN